jgi:ribosomal-protein-alanine N-acetyltransferase
MITGLHFHLATKENSVDVFPFWSDYDVTRFTLLRNIKSESDCEKKILRQIENIKTNGGLGPYCVESENIIIGYCGATSLQGKTDEFEIFYNIGKAYWGRGFGTRIAEYLLEELFERLQAKKVTAFAVVDNSASWKILEKTGMTRVGIELEEFENSEGKYDLYKYEIQRK